MLMAFVVTAETRTTMIGLSVAMLGEAPGTDLLNEWVEAYDDGMSLEDIANHIMASDAYQSEYPSLLTNQEFATAFLKGLLTEGDGLTQETFDEAVSIAVGLLNAQDPITSRGELALLAVNFLQNLSGDDAMLGMAATAFQNKVEVASYYTLDARMADPSSAVLAGVTSDPASVAKAIYDIDNPPADAVFDAVGALSIDENAASGMVGSVTATDPNDSEANPEPVSYSLMDAPDGFLIDADSGAISYAGDGLDHEAAASVPLHVVATSTGADGMPTDVSMMVDVMVNDIQESDAVFDPVGELSIDENEAMGDVGAVTATDAEGEAVTYRLGEGSHEGFSIDADSGAISYAGDGLDYEETPEINLTVVATSTGADGMPTGVEMTVTVMVGNVSENAAMFGDVGELMLAEHADGSETAVAVGAVMAMDADGDMITYSIKDAPEGWMIDGEGNLSYTGSGIDFETTQSVDLTIVATSTGASGADESVEQAVTVMIQDQNDAIFGDHELMSLNEKTRGDVLPVPLGNVVATDADEGDAVTFRLGGNQYAEGDGGELYPGFAIDEDSGAITYSGPGITHSVTGSVDLDVVATSMGDNGMMTDVETTVTINIQAWADAMFASADLMVDENADGSTTPVAAGSVVFTDANGDAVTYALKGDNDDWSLSASGALSYTGSGLDYEAGDMVSLTVVATSRGASGEATDVEKDVTVMVNNLADNPIAGLSDELTGDATLKAGTNTSDMPTGYSFVIDDKDGDVGAYSAQVYEGDDEGASTKFKALQDSDNPRIFHIVAIAGRAIDSGDYDLRVVATDGSMKDDKPVEVSMTYEVEVLRADRSDPGDADNTYNLTTGIDRFVGTNQNDLFVALTTVDEDTDRANNAAPEPTLTALDDIDGGGGYDILQLIYELGDTENITWDTSVRVANVEEVQVETTGNFGNSGTTVSLKGWDVERVKLGIVDGEVNFSAGGAVVTNDDKLGSAVRIADAETVELTDVANTANVNIATGTKTTLVDIKGGDTITISKDGTNTAGEDNANHSTTVEDVYLDGASGEVNIRSNVIDRLKLSNTNENVRVVNEASDAVDLEVTLNKYGAGTTRGTLYLDGAGAAETVDLTVAGDSIAGIHTVKVKNLDISGGNKLDLAFVDTANDVLENVKVTGAVALTMNVSENGNLKTFDASGGSGKQMLTTGDNNDALTMVKSGSGADVLTIGATAAELKTVNSGAGNDTLNVYIGPKLESIMTGSGNDELTITDANTSLRAKGVKIDLGAGDDTHHAISLNGASRVMGGSGTDVLATTTAAAVSTLTSGDVDSIYSGFEILDVTGSSTETYDLDDIDIHRVRIYNGTTTTATLDNAQLRTSLTVIGEGTGQDADVTYNLEGAANSSSDSITVNVMAMGGKDDKPAVTGDNAAPAVITGNADLDLTANQIETITIKSDVTAGGTQKASAYENVVSITGDTMATLKVTGNGKVNIDVVPDTVKTVTTSGNSGGATVDASGATNKVTFTGGSAGETFTGGGQNDTLRGNGGKDTLNGGDGADSLWGGAGDDTINGGDGVDTITGGAGADMLDGGAGNDKYNYVSGSDSRVMFDGNAASGFDKVNFVAGDVITLARGIGISEDEIEGVTARLDKGAVSSTLKAFIGDGVDFFKGNDDVDRDVASATGTIGTDDGVYMFFDSNGNGNFDVGSDFMIFVIGTAITSGDLETHIDII